MAGLLCAATNSPVWSAQSAVKSPPDERLQQLLHSLEQIRIRNNIASLGLALVNHKRIVWSGSLGVLNHGSRQAASHSTIFRIGSISKSFTALAALKLQERGLLDLSDPLTQWQTQGFFSNSWRTTHPIRIDHLLEHTAGLQDMSQPEWDYSKSQTESLQRTLSLHPAARRVQWRPGMHASYSNAGAGLVGFVLEQVADNSYEEIVSNTLFKPLKMHDSSILPPKDRHRLATGYDSDGTTEIPYWHVIFRPAAAINSTPTDMANFVQMLINKGHFHKKAVFSARSIERMETPTTSLAARHGLGFGYGLSNQSWLREGVLFYGHGGDADGYLSRYGYTRSNNSGYFLVINAFQGKSLGAIQRLIERYLIAGVVAPKTPTPATLSENLKVKLLGSYRAVTTRFPGTRRNNLQITAAAGKIFTRINDNSKTQLIPVNDTLFRRENQNEATIAIIEDEDGKIYYQGSLGNFVKIPAVSGNQR